MFSAGQRAPSLVLNDTTYYSVLGIKLHIDILDIFSQRNTYPRPDIYTIIQCMQEKVASTHKSRDRYQLGIRRDIIARIAKD